MDISETGNSLLLKVEVSGIKAEDLQVGTVYHRISLPESIKTEGVVSELKPGTLNLQLPKLAEQKGKRISIQTK